MADRQRRHHQQSCNNGMRCGLDIMLGPPSGVGSYSRIIVGRNPGRRHRDCLALQ